MPESAIALVMVTAPSHDIAGEIVTAIVDERLAACGSILPGMTSVYRWEGEVRRSDEVLILLKTTRAVLAQLIMRVEQLHPYDVPEVIAVPITAGLDRYMTWVAANVHG